VEAAVVESAQAEVTDAVAEPQQPEAAEPVVPEPAEAEPAQAEVTDAVAEPQQADADVPVEASVPEPAEAEPTQGEVADAVSGSAAVESAPAQGDELPAAALTDNVVTETPEPAAVDVPEAGEPDRDDPAPEAEQEAQADAADEAAGEQRDL
jgi:hypothetical protein